MRRTEFSGPVDIEDMQSLAQRVGPGTGSRQVGDLAWNWTMYHYRDEQCPTATWRDETGTVRAWAWLEPPADAMAQVDPAFPDLADEVVAWVAGNSPEPPTVGCADDEPVLREALLRAGFARLDDTWMNCLARPLTDLPPVPELPPGFVIRPVGADSERRAEVHCAAWGSTWFTPQRQIEMTTRWPYQSAFDLVVEAPDGAFVAYCQGWFDPVTGIGQFEPVGTASTHRRQGFGRAVCIATLHAFARAGGRQAVVCARGDDGYPVPRGLYGGMGFSESTRSFNYVLRP
ncbi:N-acetyltransferase [Hamadaea tsunoensis]|uniref:N-acetyltransferase n=1 Tax=Hamadaea tsunoensis TaxID=53368 RepID=UPI00040AF6F9|nr:N-acetyltransferase [Hamadaea tsunoensis]